MIQEGSGRSIVWADFDPFDTDRNILRGHFGGMSGPRQHGRTDRHSAIAALLPRVMGERGEKLDSTVFGRSSMALGLLKSRSFERQSRPSG